MSRRETMEAYGLAGEGVMRWAVRDELPYQLRKFGHWAISEAKPRLKNFVRQVGETAVQFTGEMKKKKQPKAIVLHMATIRGELPNEGPVITRRTLKDGCEIIEGAFPELKDTQDPAAA